MKRLHIIALLFLALLIACTPSPQFPGALGGSMKALSAIDSLMWRQPDSALAQMQVFCNSPMVDSMNEFERHYCQMLAAELLYKNYFRQSNRKEVLKAVAYFDSLVRQASPRQNDNLIFLDAHAHYINGVGYYERDSVVEACAEYLRALEVMERHFGETELVGKRARFMAYTYTRLTELFSDYYLNEQAILFGKHSLDYYQKYDAVRWHIAWTLVEIGSHYDMMRSYDSAYAYYEKAASTVTDTCSLIYRDILAHKALFNYKTGKGNKTSIKTLQKLIRNSNGEQELLARYLTMGNILYSEQQYDSAWVCLNKVFHNSQSVGAKKQVAEWLVEICKIQNRNSEIEEYADFLVPFANMNENQSTLKSQLAKLSHDFEQDKQEALHRNKTKTRMEWVGGSMAILVFIAIMLSVFHFKGKKKQMQLKEQKYETEKQLEATVKKHLNELNDKDIALSKAIAEERKRAEQELLVKEMQHSAILARTRNRIIRIQEENKELKKRKGQYEKADRQKEPYEALANEGVYRNIL